MLQGKVKITLRCLLFSYLLTGILLVSLAFALYKLHLKEGQIQLAVYATYIITCFLGGLMMGKGIRQRRFFWGLVLGLLYFAVLWLVSAALNKGIDSSFQQVVLVMGMCSIGGAVGGMFS